MKIINEKCRVKNYMKEDHHSYKVTQLLQFGKKILKNKFRLFIYSNFIIILSRV